MRTLLIITVTAFLFTSCLEDDVPAVSWDHTKFSKIEAEMPFSSVSPSYDFDYWEVVSPSDDPEGKILFRKGLICREAENPINCTLDFYGKGRKELAAHLAGNAPFYIRTNQKGYNKLWQDRDEILKFTGIVDSEGDALLIAAAYGYFFEIGDTWMSGVRKRNDGYEIIALKTVNNCQPRLINQYLLKVDRNGNISANAEKVFIDEEEACEGQKIE